MKVTVIEALRIQKEIAQAVQQAMMQERGCKYGVAKEEDVVLETQRSNAKTFPEFIEALNKLFTVSQQINSILADFSVKNGISDMVRRRENLKVLQRVYETAIQSLPGPSTTRFEIVGDKKNKVVTTFEPFVSKKDMKEKVKEIKSGIRNLQADIDSANAQTIVLPFEYEDIEMLNESED